MFIGSDDNFRKIRNIPYTHIGNNLIEIVSSTKTVGVIVDERLSWATHIDYICKEVLIFEYRRAQADKRFNL